MKYPYIHPTRNEKKRKEKKKTVRNRETENEDEGDLASKKNVPFNCLKGWRNSGTGD